MASSKELRKIRHIIRNFNGGSQEEINQLITDVAELADQAPKAERMEAGFFLEGLIHLIPSRPRKPTDPLPI